ncbi:hypothetical protein AMJ86_10405 [bacterium SM23_57]|nr:MAG: hypothetical protein AMJ86_10405 [bacterium SM23_57]
MITHKKLPPERQARRFFLKKKWSKAIEEYQKCLTEDANNLLVINLLGDTYFQKRDTEEAFDYYRKALKAFETEGLFDNAIAMAKKMSRLDPDDGKIHLKLAQLYTDQAFLTDAIAHVKTYTRFMGKKHDEAAILGIFQKIAGMTVENPSLWDQIAECYRNLEINDPELDKAMAAENFPTASVDQRQQPEATSIDTIPAEPEISGAVVAEPPQSELLDTDEMIVLPAEQEEAPSQSDEISKPAESVILEEYATEDVDGEDASYKDELISKMIENIRDKAVESDTPSATGQEPTDNFELSDILDNVLPTAEAGATPSEPLAEPETVAETKDEFPVSDEAESLMLEESEAPESLADTRHW